MEDVEQAIQLAFDDEEILCEVVCPSQIHPLNITPVLESVDVTGRLVTVEEGSHIAALSGEIVARLMEASAGLKAVRRLGNETIVPSSLSRELELLPSKDSILGAVRQVVA